MVELVLADGLRYYEAAPGRPAPEETFHECAACAGMKKGQSLRKLVEGLWSLERFVSLAPWLRRLCR